MSINRLERTLAERAPLSRAFARPQRSGERGPRIRSAAGLVSEQENSPCQRKHI